MSIDITALLSEIGNKIPALAQTSLSGYIDAATTDGQRLLATLKSDIETGTQDLIENKITKDDFSDLLLGDKDLVQMTALTEAGLALASVDAFRTAVLNLVVSSVTDFIKI